MLRFALIGCGRIAWRHAEQIARVGTLEAVCDVDGEKAQAMGKKFGARVYASLDELLVQEGEVSVVSICTPNGLHAEHAIKSLQQGKHVLCEKPMCLTTAAAWQIMDTEKFTRKRLFVVKSSRFNPLIRQLKSLISSNTLGNLYNFQLSCFWNRPVAYFTGWHGKSFPDGGPLYTQFYHYIDALVWLFGMPRSVFGHSANLAHQGVMEFEDTGTVSMKMENGMLGAINWSVNAYHKNCEISLALLCAKGTIILGGEYLNEVQYQAPGHLFSEGKQPLMQTAGATQKSTLSYHKEVYDSLAHSLQHPPESVTNSLDGLKTVQFIETIYKAVRNDG